MLCFALRNMETPFNETAYKMRAVMPRRVVKSIDDLMCRHLARDIGHIRRNLRDIAPVSDTNAFAGHPTWGTTSRRLRTSAESLFP